MRQTKAESGENKNSANELCDQNKSYGKLALKQRLEEPWGLIHLNSGKRNLHRGKRFFWGRIFVWGGSGGLQQWGATWELGAAVAPWLLQREQGNIKIWDWSSLFKMINFKITWEESWMIFGALCQQTALRFCIVICPRIQLWQEKMSGQTCERPPVKDLTWLSKLWFIPWEK